MRRLLAWMREAGGRTDRREAFRAEQRSLAAATAPVTVDPRFRRAMEKAGAGRSVLLGHAVRDPSLEVRLTLPNLLTHTLVLGATGSGKTRLVSRVVMFILREIARAPHSTGLVILDFKGEFAGLVTELTADLLDELPEEEALILLERWVAFNPFSATSLLPMQVLLRDPTVPPEIQAAELTSVVERMGGAALGVKQDSFTYNLFRFGILEGLDILDLRRLLADLPTLEARARASASIEVRETLGNATKLQKQSVDGVRARFDRLLRLPSMRLMLGAKTCVSFRDILSTKILIADVGSPPLGLSDLTSFWASFLMMHVTQSIFARSRADTARPILVLADEWQVGLASGAEVAEEFENVLALARSRAVFLWMISQSMTGAAKISTSLPEVVATNTALQLLGRAAIKDARLMSHILPVTGRCPRPAAGPWETAPRSPFLTPSEEREQLIERVPNQDARTFYLWDRRRPPGRAELVRAAAIEPRSDGFCDSGVAERLRDGVLGVPIAALEVQGAQKAPAFEPALAGTLVGARRRPEKVARSRG